MSHNNNERRELTAAELDLVSGGFYALVGGIVPGGAIISSFQTSSGSVGWRYNYSSGSVGF